jgi:hypothetical protein
MISKLFISFFLVALCVVSHAIVIAMSIRRLDRSNELADPRFWVPIWCLIRVAGLLIAIHIFEMGLWAVLYQVGQAMPDAPSAFYFSSVTYTTVGYGDLVLPDRWRLVGGIEALTGILMCGWSTGYFFTIVTRMQQTRKYEISGN